jgi:hypothetical protein
METNPQRQGNEKIMTRHARAQVTHTASRPNETLEH